MFLGKNELRSSIDEIQKGSKFTYTWLKLKEFFYTFRYVIDCIYSFFTKRYYSAVVKIDDIWYYLPDLEHTDEMHYSRTLYDINDIVAKSSMLVILDGYEVQDMGIIVFEETSDGDMDVQNILIDDIDEFFNTTKKTIPLTNLVKLSYSFK